MAKNNVDIGQVVGLIQAMMPSMDAGAISSAVTSWLDQHPEATTTVADGSITEQKLASAVAAKLAEVTDLKSALTNFGGGAAGQILRKKSNTDYDSEWSDFGAPTDVQVKNAVDTWLDDHPEATTTVDFSIATKVFPNVAAMVADSTLKSGDNIATRGYYASGDEGATNYVVSASHSGQFYVTLANGLYANMLSEKGVLKAETIGIKAYNAATQTPNSEDMDRNVTLFNTAVYNGIYLLFGKGYYYFSSAVQLARKNTYTIQGIAREVTHLYFPNSDGLLFSDPIYYNYYVVRKLHIHSYGHAIRCAEHCLTVLDSHFEWLQLESETGDCFHAPNYNVAKYVNQSGNTIYDTCVQNCVFDFINASAPQGAAFCNVMGMYTYYMHMNLVSCLYGFRNCDGVIEQLNTLGTSILYFIYYDKAYSHSLRWTFYNLNAEGLRGAFIYTEAERSAGSGEDSHKPETANIMTLELITAINSGWSLRGVTDHTIYPITVHALNNIVLINSDSIVIPNQYPSLYDTTVVKGHVNCLRSVALNRYEGGPTIIMLLNGSQLNYRYGLLNREVTSRDTVPYTTLGGSSPTFTSLNVRRLFGGKSMHTWEVIASSISGSQPNPPSEYAFCDIVAFNVDISSGKNISVLMSNYECVYPGRIITLVNRKESVGNLTMLSFGMTNYSNYTLHSSWHRDLVLTPGQSMQLALVFDKNPKTGNIYPSWLPMYPPNFESLEAYNDNIVKANAKGDDASIAMQNVNVGQYIPFNDYNKYLNTSGATVDYSSPGYSTKEFRYLVTDCSEGDNFTIINGIGENTQRLWAFADSEGTIISRAAAHLSVTTLTITAPANATKLIVNTKRPTAVYRISI